MERRFIPLRVALAVVSLAGIQAGCSPVENKISKATSTPIERRVTPEKVTPDLEVKLDETGFWKNVKGGARWGLLPNTPDKDKLACPIWAPGICLGEYSSNFKVAVNGPIADFMFRQTQAINPLKPIKMILVEDWIKADTGEYLAGGTNILAGEINVAISLKALAWNVFLIMENGNILTVPNAGDHFQGTMSLLASRTTAHELMHAGVQPKKLGMTIPLEMAEKVHPQIYAFEEKYSALVYQAGTQGYSAEGLIFGIEPVENFNLLEYRNLINNEAKSKGLVFSLKSD